MINLVNRLSKLDEYLLRREHRRDQPCPAHN
jgi:hypothetical protein